MDECVFKLSLALNHKRCETIEHIRTRVETLDIDLNGFDAEN